MSLLMRSHLSLSRLHSRAIFERPRPAFPSRNGSSTSGAEEQTRLVQLAKKRLSPGMGKLAPELVFESGKGSWVYTVEGKKYLDFTSGIAVTSTGHSHPEVVKAAQEQLGKILHAQVNIAFHRPMIELSEKLASLLPPSLDCFFFWNSGAEAVEASIKLARQATGKPNIIVFDGSYHGRTIGTMSLTTSKTIYRSGFGPLMPGVFVAPYPYCLHCPVSKDTGSRAQECCNDAEKRLELMFKTQTAPDETAAVLIEPILGEGGYVIPPPGFLKAVKKICEKNNVLMIADEIQTGVFRTGKFFAFEHFDFVPDILIIAKGLASGLPLSGIASSHSLMQKQPPGSMGGTYAGNIVACAAALATLRVLTEQDVLSNVNQRSKELFSGLRKLQSKYPAIWDVRGKGLMIGIEFDPKHVQAGFANLVTKKALSQGLLLLTASTFETIRLMPQLFVTADECSTALGILDLSITDSLKELSH